jgi:hypothetical protein
MATILQSFHEDDSCNISRNIDSKEALRLKYGNTAVFPIPGMQAVNQTLGTKTIRLCTKQP